MTSFFPTEKDSETGEGAGGVRRFVLPINSYFLEVGVSDDEAPLRSRVEEQSKVVRLPRGSFVSVFPVCEALDGWLTTQTKHSSALFFFFSDVRTLMR